MDEIQLIRELRSFASEVNENYPYTWYDSVNYEYPNITLYEPFLKFLEKSNSLLILGAHINQAIANLANSRPDLQITVMDFNPEHVRRGKELAPSNVEYVCKPFSEYKPDKLFDAFYCFGVYSYIPDPERKAIHRLLKHNVAKIALLTYEGVINAAPWIEIRDFAKWLTNTEGRITDLDSFIKRMYEHHRVDSTTAFYLNKMRENPKLLKDVIYQPIIMPQSVQFTKQLFTQLGFKRTLLVDQNMSIYLDIVEK